jgi:hypothetical protein
MTERRDIATRFQKRPYVRRDPTTIAAVAAWYKARAEAKRLYKSFGTNAEKAKELGMTTKNFEQLMYIARDSL